MRSTQQSAREATDCKTNQRSKHMSEHAAKRDRRDHKSMHCNANRGPARSKHWWSWRFASVLSWMCPHSCVFHYAQDHVTAAQRVTSIISRHGIRAWRCKPAHCRGRGPGGRGGRVYARKDAQRTLQHHAAWSSAAQTLPQQHRQPPPPHLLVLNKAPECQAGTPKKTQKHL